MSTEFFRCFHVAEPKQWELAQKTGVYTPSNYVNDGFIHCCTESQLSGVITRFFSDKSGLLVLDLDTHRIRDRIRFENLENGVELFPHLYSTISVSDVIKIINLDRTKKGIFDLSEI